MKAGDKFKIELELEVTSFFSEGEDYPFAAKTVGLSEPQKEEIVNLLQNHEDLDEYNGGYPFTEHEITEILVPLTQEKSLLKVFVGNKIEQLEQERDAINQQLRELRRKVK